MCRPSLGNYSPLAARGATVLAAYTTEQIAREHTSPKLYVYYEHNDTAGEEFPFI